MQLSPPSHEGVCAFLCVWTEIMFFCPQVQPLWEIIAFQSLQIIPLPLWITLSHVYWSLFYKQHGMCAEPECVVIHRGQAANEGRGHCLSWGGGADSLPLHCEEIWPEGLLPAPIGSHVTEESHLHINLLLYCSFLPPLHLSLLAQYAVASDEIQINHIFIVWLCLTHSPFHSSTFALVPLLWRGATSQRCIPNALFVVKPGLWEKCSPSPCIY